MRTLSLFSCAARRCCASAFASLKLSKKPRSTSATKRPAPEMPDCMAFHSSSVKSDFVAIRVEYRTRGIAATDLVAEQRDRVLEAAHEPGEVEFGQLRQRLDREVILVQRVVPARRGRKNMDARQTRVEIAVDACANAVRTPGHHHRVDHLVRDQIDGAAQIA